MMENISDWPPWTRELFDGDFISKIVEIATLKDYRKGEIIYCQGDKNEKVFFLLKGRVEVSIINNDGKKRILSIHEPYCFVGETILDGFSYMTTAYCLSDVRIAVLEMSTILGSKDNLILTALLKSLVLKMRILMSLIQKETFEVSDRVESLLYSLGIRFGEKNSEGIILNLPLTHQLIADLVGCSRVRVSQTMKDLKNDKRVVKKSNKLYMLPVQKPLEHLPKLILRETTGRY
ncbi:Crp/Fnr family transcriptional regulator [Neomoorella humiferrea]|uniref:Crp/Fnr family transcriptional regulator n=1 Tax=Neomoorella humiferrea TaxID=676965 RepID=UPI0030CF77C3